MVPIKPVLAGAWIACMWMGTLYAAYTRGTIDKEAEIVYNCNEYGAYKFDGTQKLLCSGIIEPDRLMPNEKVRPKETKERNSHKR